jgi:hypothetical protein
MRPTPWRKSSDAGQDVDTTSPSPSGTGGGGSCPTMSFTDFIPDEGDSPYPTGNYTMQVTAVGGTLVGATWSIIEFPEGPDFGVQPSYIAGNTTFCNFTFSDVASYGITVTAYNSCGNSVTHTYTLAFV